MNLSSLLTFLPEPSLTASAMEIVRRGRRCTLISIWNSKPRAINSRIEALAAAYVCRIVEEEVTEPYVRLRGSVEVVQLETYTA